MTIGNRAIRRDWTGESGARAVAAIAIGINLLVAILFAMWIAFPTGYDELAHVSAIWAQVADPQLFPDLRAYRLLDPEHLTRWSDASNYLNHPSLYYLAMAAVTRVSDTLRTLRGVNIALSVAALLLVVHAGWQRFDTAFGRAAFAVAAAAFPKQPIIAAGVNNDNLAACAAAAVFAGMAGARGAVWWLAGGLALAGWTKLTALIALATVVGCRQLWRSLRGETRWLGMENIAVAAGLAVGAIPYVANLLQIGHLLYINEGFVFVPPASRPVLDTAGFLGWFITQAAMKWPAAEQSLPLIVAAALTLTAPILTLLAVRKPDAARIVAPYLIGLAVTLTAHILFGLSAFERLGDQSTPQTRYYNILWPGIAFGAAVTVARIRATSLAAALACAVLLLVPTAAGGILIAQL